MDTTLPKIETVLDIAAFLAELSTASKQSMAELNARVLATEQKQARPGGPGMLLNAMGGVDLTKSFTESRGFEDVKAGRQGAKASIDLPADYFAGRKDFIGLGGVAGGLGQTDRASMIVPLPKLRFTIRSLLPVVPTTGASVAYVQQTTFTNAAALVEEGTVKPQTAMTFVLKNAPVVVIAHLAKTSMQLMADFPALQEFIQNRMTYGVSLLEEQELLVGSGVGMHLQGLLTEAPIYTDAVVGATRLDSIRRAAADLENSFFVPNGVVLNPADWAEFELTKSTTGEYLLTQPAGASDSLLWSLPVVRSPTMPKGQYLLADFTQAATLFDRMQPRLELGLNLDDFQLNLVSCRAESRIALATHTPNAMRKGTFA